MAKDIVSYADFEKLDLRIGKILSVSDHPNANKLYVLEVDLNEDKPRIIVAGLRNQKHDVPPHTKVCGL